MYFRCSVFCFLLCWCAKKIIKQRKRKKTILKLSKKKHCYLSPKYIRKLQNYTKQKQRKKWNRNDTREPVEEEKKPLPTTTMPRNQQVRHCQFAKNIRIYGEWLKYQRSGAEWSKRRATQRRKKHNKRDAKSCWNNEIERQLMCRNQINDTLAIRSRLAYFFSLIS